MPSARDSGGETGASNAATDRRIGRRSYLGAVGAAGLAASAGCLGGSGSGATTINVITWEEYQDLTPAIEDTLDVDINVTVSSSSKEMFNKWNAGGAAQFDIAVPNNNYVPRMMDADLAAPVNRDVVTNWDSLYDKFQAFADTQFTSGGNYYGVPIRFGWYGYSYDTRTVGDHEPSYKALFEPDYLDADVDGELIMYDDMFKTLSATALYLGYRDAFEGERVTLSSEQIAEVKNTLIDQKPRLQGYIAKDPRFIQSFKQGEFLVGHSGRNEIVEMLSNGNTWPEFVAPKEGALAWFESAVVSKQSDNPEMAWRVINEFISASNGATLAEVGFSPSCNPKTQQELSEQQNERYGAIDPSRLEAMIPFKAIDDKEPEWQSAWEEVKAA